MVSACQRAGASTPAQHCLPNGKGARSRAPAQHCTQACQMVTRLALRARLADGNNTPSSAPAQHTPATWQAHSPKRTRSALYARLPFGKHTRARSALYARLPNGRRTRPSAPAQHCTHACHIISTPAQAHQLSTARTPA